MSELAVEAELTRRGDGVFARGRVKAVVTQTCVVTLEPFDAQVDEPFEVEYRAGGQARGGLRPRHGRNRSGDRPGRARWPNSPIRRTRSSTAGSTRARWPPNSLRSASIPIRASPASNSRAVVEAAIRRRPSPRWRKMKKD